MNIGTSGQSNMLTLIVIGTRWGTLSFQVSRRAGILTAGVVLVCVVLAIYGLIRITEFQGTPSAEALMKMQKATKKDLQTQQAENATLREKLRRLENQFISVGQKPPQEDVRADSTGMSQKPSEIAVDQFKMRYQDGGYHFQFNLKTVVQKKGKTAGYIFVLLPPDRSYPMTTLHNGKPGNVKEGEHFAILRQKTISGVITKVADPKVYQRADILIYSEEGVLVYHNTFSLKDL